MALLRCHECGQDVSSEAKTCPHCGAKVVKPKAPKKAVGPLGLTIAAFFLVSFIWSIAQESPEERQEAAMQNAHIEAAAKFRRAFINQIQPGLREPESLVWDNIQANDDGSVICGIYRARNGFGGMSQGGVVYAGGQIKDMKLAKEGECASAVHNITWTLD